MRKLSTNSADGRLRFLAAAGLMFQACSHISVSVLVVEAERPLTQPMSAKQPAHLPRVRMPNQKKTPPLMKCASPLKISWPI